MLNTKLKPLRIVLLLCAGYYLVGTLAHFFGLTIFPWYDAALYMPYHDTVIALCALVFSLLFFIVARDPIKNIDLFYGILIGFVLAMLFNLYIIFHIELGNSIKRFQTIIETFLILGTFTLLLILRPRKAHLH